MKELCCRLVLNGALFFTAFSPYATSAQTLAAEQRSVQVFASVSAKEGPVVSPSLLSALIDDQPAQVVSMRPAKDDKLLFVLMVDMSGSMNREGQTVKLAASRIFQDLSSERSEGYLALTDTKTYVSRRPLQPTEERSELDHAPFVGGSSLYDGIAQVCMGVLSRSQNPNTPRRVLILITDGDDNYSRTTFAKAEQEAEREGVAVFSFAILPNSDRRNFNWSLDNDVLVDLSRATGGIKVSSASKDGVAALEAAIQGQALLSIASPPVVDHKLHSLAVQVRQKGISISAPTHIVLPESQ